jgi:hypothetical protein
MVDLLYLAGTVAFFALMLGYVAFCERLGRAGDTGDATTGSRQ